MPTEDPEVFQAFRYCLYVRRLSALASSCKMDMEQLCKLWVFADAHEVPLLQNTVIDAVRFRLNATSERRVAAQCVNYVYKNTLTGSRLRKLLMDVFGKIFDPAQDLDMKAWPKEALLDLLAMVSFRPIEGTLSDVLSPSNACIYHLHSGGTLCV